MASNCNKLFAINFTVAAESGLALVAAPDERSAVQILKSSGSRSALGRGYVIEQILGIGIAESCNFGLLMESYVNSFTAFDAIAKAANKIRGVRGPSMYEDAVEHGYEGTYEQWMEEHSGAKGDKGDKGDTGEAGLRGPQGIQGIQGEQGIQGIQGEVGPRGPVGVESVSITVDNTYGGPAGEISLNDGAMNIHLSGVKGNPGEPGASNAENVIVESLPTASNSTQGKIYLTQVGDTDVYNRYITQYDGTNYSWVQIGTTEANMTDYVRKDSIVYLTEAQWNALTVKDITKEYRIYETE